MIIPSSFINRIQQQTLFSQETRHSCTQVRPGVNGAPKYDFQAGQQTMPPDDAVASQGC